MASTYTDLGIEKMATGENAGTWGTKTNTNLDIIEKAVAGYVEKAVTSGGTTQLTITDGDATESTSVARHAVIKLTGTITGNSIVTVPDSIEKVYIVVNGTSGAYTVQFKTASGSGITFGASDKGTRLVFSDGTNIVDTATGGVGSYDLNGDSLILDEDQDTTITADTDDQIDIAIAGADDFRFTANTFTALSGSSVVIPDSGLTLGSTAVTSTAAELNLLDGVSGLVQADFTKLAAVDSTAAELNIVDGGTSATSTTVADADRVVLNDNGTMVQVAVTDLAAYFDDEITAMPNLTSIGTLTTLTVDNIIINGTNIGHTSDTDALAIDSSGNVTASQNLIVTGDLTVSGDDITMGTNTAGNLLIADGTNFNSVAVGSLSEISTIASDDVFLAVDTSGGGLKKVARSTVVSGLATSAAISNIVEDTSPQLGGNLDTNSFNIAFDDAHGINDENGNEQIIFQTTSSAVNQFDITNAATGSGPKLQATGGDSNIDLDIEAKGTGHVTVRGNTNSGAIQFNCESNSHGQQIKAQPHSAGVTNVMLLPDGADSTLVSLVATQTLTNKTLTTPVIAEIDSLSSGDITLDADGDINLDAGGADINFKDDGTKFGHVKQSSSNMYIQVETQDKDIHFRGNDNGSIFNALILDMSEAGAATFNDKITAVGTSVFTNLDISGDIDVDGTANLDVVDIDGAVDMASTLQVDGAITSSTGATITVSDNSDTLTLKSTDADANAGPILALTRDSGSPADDDVLGRVIFKADDDAGNVTEFLTVDTRIADASNGTEDFKTVFSGMVAGTSRHVFTLGSTEAVFNDGSQDIDFRVETNAEANAFKIDAGNETFDFNIPGTITVSDNSDTLTLVSTDADANLGPVLNLYRNSSSPADSDVLGRFKFVGRNDNSQDWQAMAMTVSASDVSDGTEDATMDWYIMNNGSETLRLSYQATETVFNDASIDLDFRVETNAEANAFKIDGGSETAAFGVPVTFNDAANVAQEAITSSSNAVAWDATDKPNAYHQTSENTTFSAPSNAVEGAFICVEINYNGSHTIAWNTVFEFAASTAPTATSTDGKTDILVFRYNGSVWQEVGRTLNLSES